LNQQQCQLLYQQILQQFNNEVNLLKQQQQIEVCLTPEQQIEVCITPEQQDEMNKNVNIL
jgi:hypothetical protein